MKIDTHEYADITREKYVVLGWGQKGKKITCNEVILAGWNETNSHYLIAEMTDPIVSPSNLGKVMKLKICQRIAAGKMLKALFI